MYRKKTNLKMLASTHSYPEITDHALSLHVHAGYFLRSYNGVARYRTLTTKKRKDTSGKDETNLGLITCQTLNSGYLRHENSKW